ncbi:hypothetical protein EBU71_13670 [bacterium]|nr:hypothetical protein [Candidatus Elulimicrobium humile]
MESIYTLIQKFEASSGKLRWNEICNDIVIVYNDMFPKHEQQYTESDLWSLLFEPNILKMEKQRYLEECLKDEKHILFFSKLLPYFLQDKFKEGLDQGKILFKNNHS